MSSTKKFLYGIAAIYVVCAAMGIVLFHSPNYSKGYMAKFKEEHERRHHILKNEEYKAYIERPALHHADATLLADVEFVKEYEARPEFQAEKSRIFWYNMYFKILNSVVFIALMGKAIYGPTVKFLDEKIVEIRTELENAEKARTEAQQAKSKASAKMDQWRVIEEDLQKETDDSIQKHMAEINREFEEARAQLQKETGDRRLAEELRAARLVKEEAVTSALAQLETRYRTEATQELLAKNVDTFVRLMDRLS